MVLLTNKFENRLVRLHNYLYESVAMRIYLQLQFTTFCDVQFLSKCRNSHLMVNHIYEHIGICTHFN